MDSDRMGNWNDESRRKKDGVGMGGVCQRTLSRTHGRKRTFGVRNEKRSRDVLTAPSVLRTSTARSARVCFAIPQMRQAKFRLRSEQLNRRI